MRCAAVLLCSLCFGCSKQPTTREATAPPSPQAATTPPSAALRSASDFASITDKTARAQALFVEAGKVLLHDRCLNCHPSDDRPRQRHAEAHEPPVVRGRDDRGAAVLECSSCHQQGNAVLARVPGAPGWHLAPREMAWRDRTLGEICLQLKDPKRNGGKSLAEIVRHSSYDPLVGWGWAPGADREPAPGTQAQFGALIAAWVEAGAACPPTGRTP